MWWKYGLSYAAGTATGVLAGFYYIQQEIQSELDKLFENKDKR